MSFKRALIATAIIPFVLFCLLFTVSFWRKDMRRAHQDAEKLLTQNIRVQSERIEAYLSRIEEVCRGTAGMLGKRINPDSVNALTPEDVYDYLQDIIAARPEVAGAGVAFYPKYRKTGDEPFFHYAIYRSGSPQEGNLVVDNLDMGYRPFLQAEWFTEPARRRKGVWGKPEHYVGLGVKGRADPTAGWGLTYSHPLIWGDEVLGVVVVGTFIKEFSLTLNRGMTDMGYSAYCAVLGSDGTYYFHPDFDHVATHTTLQSDLKGEGDGPAQALALFSARKSGISRVKTTCDTDDRWLTMMQAPLSFVDWTLVVFLPEDNFFAPVRAQLYSGIAWIIVDALIAMAIVLYGLYLFSRPIRELTRSAKEITNGNLQPLTRTYRFKEFNVMAGAFNGMLDAIRARNEAMQATIAKLDKIIHSVSLSANELTNVANIVSASSQGLSAGAVQQDSLFMRIFDSVAMLKEHADSNSAMAAQTNSIIGEAEQLAVTGNIEMHRLSDAMQAISESSDDINKALHFIDNIAFQTNILAINAAVEAARAGRHGMGFSVVAAEVRNLANRSARSVVSTSRLLEESGGKVHVGVELGQSTAKSFMQIEDIATRAAKLMATVTEQAIDQSRIVGEIVSGLHEVAEITKRNINDASSNAAISEELLRLAYEMHDMLQSSTGIGGQTRMQPESSPEYSKNLWTNPLLRPKSAVSVDFSNGS